MREMKDSGVEWIGEIPREWETQKAKWIFKERNEKGNSIVLQLLSPSQKYGVIPQSELDSVVKVKEDTDLSTFKTIHAGDYCISLRSFQGGFEYSTYEGVVSPAYHVFYANGKICDSYYKFLFKCVVFIEKIASLPLTLRDGKNISFDMFGDMLIPIPPLSDQQKISTYLDTKCTKIDSIIEKQEKVIEKLKEYKLSVITEAVTKGLNPDVKMKDSGVEWIGEIPEEWELPKIKYIATIGSGGTPNRNNPEYWNGNINWFKTGELQNNEIFESEEKITEQAVENSSANLFPVNTILMAMYGQGKTRGMTGLLKSLATTNQACAGITINNSNVNVMFLWKFLMGAYNAIRENAIGSGQPNLSSTLIGNFRVTMPPLNEQHQIVNYLDKKCSAIDKSIEQKQAIIEKLKEYKKSLIYEVVTGKREV